MENVQTAVIGCGMGHTSENEHVEREGDPLPLFQRDLLRLMASL